MGAIKERQFRCASGTRDLVSESEAFNRGRHRPTGTILEMTLDRPHLILEISDRLSSI
jgi:hypothetical protein